MEWKDATSYSRHDMERKPRWWTTTIGGIVGGIRVSVGNDHIYYPKGKTWLMHAQSLGFDTYVLKAKNEHDAKAEALQVIAKKCRAVLKYIEDDSVEGR